ncbi:MAG: DegT/DnrJ/EryC1/StrS family aminotransferase [Bacteroidetes bacterium]|nr:DegT/DnrJ/EryC1/StrS family aminotransferase [Bacteroidota bacterium]
MIDKRWLTEGPFSREFLKLLQDFTGAKYAVLANNGTLALYLALKALDIKSGDEVIVPDFTFNASGSSVAFAGGRPVFVDVDRNNLNIDATKIEEAITEKTKAIMPVHVYGQSADMDPIVEIARKHNIRVIEDAAQGYGVFYKGWHTGTIGDVGTISFFADKTITTGEGAVVLTNNEEIYKNLRAIRNQGRESSGTFIHPELGMNFRMTDLQCAVGVAQIKKFKEIEVIKLKNYYLYKKLLAGMNELEFVEETTYSNYMPFRTAVKVMNLKGLCNYLKENGIQTRGFFYPLHRQPCFSYLGYSKEAFPVSNMLNDTGLCLPVHCFLTEEDIKYVCKIIKKFYGSSG